MVSWNILLLKIYNQNIQRKGQIDYTIPLAMSRHKAQKEFLYP